MSTSLDDDFAAFLQHGAVHGWEPVTVQGYARRLADISRFCRARGCQRAADVTPADLDALMQARLDDGTARSSRIGLATILRQVFAWMQDQGRILRSPARSLPIPDDGAMELPRPPLSEDEVHALLASLPRRTVVELRNACFIELLYSCGLRRGEALALDTDDVDLTARTVWVEDGKCGQNRLLPLMGTAATAVRDWLALRRTLVRGPDTGAFFLTREGKRMGVPTSDNLFRRLREERGPEARWVHPHLLRHSVAVHLLRGGADVRHIQAFLGHSSLDTTKIYLRMVPGHLREDYDEAMPEIATGLPAAP